MLIKNDFDQIRKIVREEIGNEALHVKEELEHEIRMSRMEIRNDIRDLQDRIKNLEIRVAKAHNEDIDEEDL